MNSSTVVSTARPCRRPFGCFASSHRNASITARSRYTALHFTVSPSSERERRAPAAPPHPASVLGSRSAKTVNVIAEVVNSARKTSSMPDPARRERHAVERDGTRGQRGDEVAAHELASGQVREQHDEAAARPAPRSASRTSVNPNDADAAGDEPLAAGRVDDAALLDAVAQDRCRVGDVVDLVEDERPRRAQVGQPGRRGADDERRSGRRCPTIAPRTRRVGARPQPVSREARGDELTHLPRWRSAAGRRRRACPSASGLRSSGSLKSNVSGPRRRSSVE